MTASFALLSATELRLLRRFAFGADWPSTANAESEALIYHDLVNVRDGMPVLTPLGYSRLMIEITRTSWFERRGVSSR